MAENHKWNENGDHLVLFMDIMGFKDRVTRMEHQDLLNKMIEFKALLSKEIFSDMI